MSEKKALEVEKKEHPTDVKWASPSPAPRSTPRQEELQAEIAQFSIEIDAMKVLIKGPHSRLEDRKALISNSIKGKNRFQL